MGEMSRLAECTLLGWHDSKADRLNPGYRSAKPLKVSIPRNRENFVTSVRVGVVWDVAMGHSGLGARRGPSIGGCECQNDAWVWPRLPDQRSNLGWPSAPQNPQNPRPLSVASSWPSPLGTALWSGRGTPAAFTLER